MAVNKTLLIYAAFDLLFLGCAGLLIAIPLVSKEHLMQAPTKNSVARSLLLEECPLIAAVANGVLMVLAFLISIPGMFLSENRGLLIAHSWVVVASAVFTLAIGLTIWFSTLGTKKNLVPLWNAQSNTVISLLEEKFQCCGYMDPTHFVVNDICTNAAEAASHGLCLGPFSSYSNQFLSIVFTAMFGICAVDGFLILSVLCVLKERAEQIRYRRIDEKNGYGRG